MDFILPFFIVLLILALSGLIILYPFKILMIVIIMIAVYDFFSS